MQQFIDTLLQNQIVTGLTASGVIGGLLYYLRELPRNLFKFILNIISITISVNNIDDNYEFIQEFVMKQKFILRNSYVSINTINEKVKLQTIQKFNCFWYKNTLVIVYVRRLEPNGPSISYKTPPLEFLELQILTLDNKLAESLINDALQTVYSKHVLVKNYNTDWWGNTSYRTPRDPKTLILNSGVFESIINDINWFLNSKSWYLERGIPYRRGYLFSGLPGTGKTSIAFVLASMFNRTIFTVNLGNMMSQQQLFESITSTTDNSIILLEDIDCANTAVSRESSKKITLSGLLNILDGVNTPCDRIFILTTNYPDKLDPALIRPGRVDLHIEFEKLNPEAQIRMANLFYPINSFKPLDFPIEAAKLQEAFMRFPNNPIKAREFLQKELE